MNLRIVLRMSWVLIRIALNLYIAFNRMVIFTILPIHGYGISFHFPVFPNFFLRRFEVLIVRSLSHPWLGLFLDSLLSLILL